MRMMEPPSDRIFFSVGSEASIRVLSVISRFSFKGTL